MNGHLVATTQNLTAFSFPAVLVGAVLGLISCVQYPVATTHTEVSTDTEVSIAANPKFTLTGVTDNPYVSARFDCEGDGLHKFPYATSGLDGVGKMGFSSCKLEWGVGVVNREFHLQAQSGSQHLENILYKINTWTGSVNGDGLLKQQPKFFDVGDDHFAMSYGVSRFPSPVGDQAYIYVSRDHSTWMGDLLFDVYGDIMLGQLVLSGSHDAGMYVVGETSQVRDHIGEYCKIGPLKMLCGQVGSKLGSQMIVNLALTQKSSALTQLKLGTRFFDFRPAAPKGDAPTADNTYHVHNFVPGAKFADFLKEINTFYGLVPHGMTTKEEVVVLQIKTDGIDKDHFTPLDREQVTSLVSAYIKEVPFSVVDSLESMRCTKLRDMKEKLIVLFRPSGVNDSYSESVYEHSLTNADGVLGKLRDTQKNCSGEDKQFSVFQLQDTGNGWVMNDGNRTTILKNNPVAWANDLLSSGTGSVLQATKPAFDRSTYTWLSNQTVADGMLGCHGPVVLLNDFVDGALASIAVAQTKIRSQFTNCPRNVADPLGPSVAKPNGNTR